MATKLVVHRPRLAFGAGALWAVDFFFEFALGAAILFPRVAGWALCLFDVERNFRGAFSPSAAIGASLFL